MKERNRIYFVSDLHLGMHPLEESLEREKTFVDFLERIRHDARELWLLGDIFDYWFEYRKVVPRGFTRFLGKLASLSDEGIDIHFFPGNHDIWVFDYLPNETGMTIHHRTVTVDRSGRKFHLGHGDGLHPGDFIYNSIQWIFKNRSIQRLYSWIHPNGSTAFAHWWSRKSRTRKGAFLPFLGVENEHQVQFARKQLEMEPDIDYFVFGHRHVPFDIRIGEKSRVICLGDWIENFTYGVFDGHELRLERFYPDRGEILVFP
jgi:UDP-2,3-diacylglucosamine hydrolase